jgi:phytoene/squalene synthetase
VADADLGRRSTTPELRALMAFEVKRARALLDEGLPLARKLPRRYGLAVAGFVAGGRSALRAIERANYDVLGKPTRANAVRRAAELARILLRIDTG